MLKPKLSQQEQGLTLVEVMIAILITSIFIAVSMQSVVIAAYFKARGKQYAEATTWIQEDLEQVRYRASQLPYDSTKCNAPAQDKGFAHQLRINLPDVDQTPGGDQHTGTKKITGKTYVLYRDGPEADSVIGPNVSETTYEVMTMKYEVKPQGSDEVIARMYTEVIPDAAFQCP